MKDVLVFHHVSKSAEISKMTIESQLRLGQIFLKLSEIQKVDQFEIIQLLFQNVEKPIQRIYTVLTSFQ